jgi:acyl-CoA hydrolase
MSGTAKPPVDREAIRALVRQVLRDALPDTVREKIAVDAAKSMGSKPAAPAAGKPVAGAKPANPGKPETAAPRTEEVSIGNDGELATFVRRLMSLAQDKKQREAIQAGRLKFQLKQASRAPASPGGGSTERIDKGLVTERRLIAAAKAGKKLVLAKGVVLTPLARDKARQLGVQIERE